MLIRLIKTSLLFSIILSSCSYNKTVRWYSSTNEQRWDEQRNLVLYDFDSTKIPDIIIDPDQKQQQIYGFGGCLNELGWDALSLLPEKSRKEAIKRLFDKYDGLNINICRVPIGASDYARDYYSLNDSIGDYSMNFFSIERDKGCIIPFIKEIQEYRSDIILLASPWTPPFWMKKNNHYACSASRNNGMNYSIQGKPGDNLINNDSLTLDTYSRYLVKYIQSYHEEGIDINYLMIQNDFNFCKTYPSCLWEPSLIKLFIYKNLIPKFRDLKLSSEIIYGSNDKIQNIDSIISCDSLKNDIKGFCIQNITKANIDELLTYPDILLFQCSSHNGNGKNEWTTAESDFITIKQYFENRANVYLFYNLVLDESSKNLWDFRQNSVITVDRRLKKVRLNPSYYLLKHYSYFIKKGAYKICTSGKNDNVIAFINKDNKIVIVLANRSDDKKQINIQIVSRLISVELKPHSFNTFVTHYY